jgi:hypothetical protein
MRNLWALIDAVINDFLFGFEVIGHATQGAFDIKSTAPLHVIPLEFI